MESSQREDYESIFTPKTVAIIGASSNTQKFGHQIVKFLKEGEFGGQIFPINPSTPEILTLRSFPSVFDLPVVPDMAAVVLPATHVVQAVKDCVDRGVKVVVVISSGFAEAGEEGRHLQEELKRIVSGTRTCIVGPNCEGVINVWASMLLSFSVMFSGLRKGPVSIVSQSGSYCGITANRIQSAGIGISKIVSSGNEAHLAAVDYFRYLADDPDTKVIVAYLEEIRKPLEFKECIAEISRKKPVIIQKAGRTKVGQKAVISHTGALAGSDAVVSALFKQSGVIRAKSIGELIDSAISLATQPLVKGNRVAILAGAGGLAVEMAELCSEAGFQFPALTEATQEKLKQRLPYFASVSNPIDMTGAILSNPEQLGEVLQAVVEDPEVDAILFILTIARSVEFAEVVTKIVEQSDKPILMCWTAGKELTPDPINYLMERGIPYFDSPERLRTALKALTSYSKYRLGDDFIQVEGEDAQWIE